MSEIIPRWEWRRFAENLEDLGDATSVIASRSPDRVQESDEVYLLSARGTDAVKLRDDLMDVKRLLAVDEDGLEQWTPVLKAAAPLSSDDVDQVLAALGVEAPPGFAREACTFRDFVEELVRPHPDRLAVEVHKRRERYEIRGCLAELTEVRTARASTLTIAIESEDPARVVAAVDELGLPRRPNIGFARGLKALVDFGTERHAVIDVGTNSVKFHVGERAADGAWRRIVDRAEMTRLGEGLHETGRLGAEAIERTVGAVAAMADEAWRRGSASLTAVGTAGLRIASNSPDFLGAVRTRCGVDVEVISGEEETRLAYLGATAGLGPSPGSSVVFDTGGGSSQFTFGVGDRVDERFSLDVGAVRYTEAYAC